MFINTNKQIISGKNEIILNKIQKNSLSELRIEISSDTIIPKNKELIIYVDNDSSKNPTINRKEYIFSLNDKLKSFEKIGDEIRLNLSNDESLTAPFTEETINNVKDADHTLDENRNISSDNLGIELFDDTTYIYTNYEDAIITLAYDDSNNVIDTLSNEGNSLELNADFSLDDIYFKDAFTKSGDKLNLEVNNANIDCLLSRNNKFSLDSDGNLIVNSITTNNTNNQLTKQDICNFIYPIGSLYMSINSTSPANLFGGTWARINGYYLYAGTGGKTAGSNKSGASSGNTGSTVLTIKQIPSHEHDIAISWSSSGVNNNERHIFSDNTGFYGDAQFMNARPTGGGEGHTHTLNNHTHSVTPLRYEVYAWRRTA